jgi:hypothetical protein
MRDRCRAIFVGGKLALADGADQPDMRPTMRDDRV